MRTTSIAIAAVLALFAGAVPYAAFGKDATVNKKTPSVHVAKKSLNNCTSFDQTDKDEDTVLFTVKSTCTIPIDCTVSWKLVCAPASKSRRAEHAKSVAFASMGADSSRETEASASECGMDGWSIEQIQWGCQPNKD